MKRRRGREVDGWLLVDKPEGISSAGAVGRAQRAYDAKKAGHGGTLDPLATGVLPIAFGNATKTVPFVMDGTKIYRFTLRFGESRSTDDREGEVLARSGVRPTDAAIEAALPRFVGDILQVPPVYSALKVGGARAYDLARAGRDVALAPRPARVDRFALVGRPDADHAVFEVQSGKGVYMRSLARDIAVVAGSVGHVSLLRRIRVGPFGEADTIPLDNLAPGGEKALASPDLLLPIATALADIPALAVTGEEAAFLSNGRALDAAALEGRFPGAPDSPRGLIRAMAGERVLALCRIEDGWLKPERIVQPMRHGEQDDVDFHGASHDARR